MDKRSFGAFFISVRYKKKAVPKGPALQGLALTAFVSRHWLQLILTSAASPWSAVLLSTALFFY